MHEKTTESFVERIMQALPPGLHNLSDDLKSIVHERIKQQLLKLDLISREEFDTQAAVLKRCQQQLAELEAQITALNADSAHSNTPVVDLSPQPPAD